MLPPNGTLYQFKLPALTVALKVNDAGRQLETGVVPVIVGIFLILASTAIRGDEVQPLSLVST